MVSLCGISGFKMVYYVGLLCIITGIPGMYLDTHIKYLGMHIHIRTQRSMYRWVVDVHMDRLIYG